MGRILFESTLTCPHCGARKTETMPSDACQYYYRCESCAELLKPLPGDCCVFCSYGSVACPPRQAGASADCDSVKSARRPNPRPNG